MSCFFLSFSFFPFLHVSKRKIPPYHFETHEPVFHHQILDQRPVLLAHVRVVVGLAHARLAIGADSPAEETLSLRSHFCSMVER